MEQRPDPLRLLGAVMLEEEAQMPAEVLAIEPCRRATRRRRGRTVPPG